MPTLSLLIGFFLPAEYVRIREKQYWERIIYIWTLIRN